MEVRLLLASALLVITVVSLLGIGQRPAAETRPVVADVFQALTAVITALAALILSGIWRI